MSSDIAWAITRNNSAYLLKKRGCPKPFNTDPLNLTNKNSQRYAGSVHKKAVGVTACDDKKGFVVSVKRGSSGKPGKNVARVDMKSGARSSLNSLKSMMTKQRYRKDLTKAALRRAAAVVRSQRKELPKRKGVKAAKKE